MGNVPTITPRPLRVSFLLHFDTISTCEIVWPFASKELLLFGIRTVNCASLYCLTIKMFRLVRFHTPSRGSPFRCVLFESCTFNRVRGSCAGTA